MFSLPLRNCLYDNSGDAAADEMGEMGRVRASCGTALLFSLSLIRATPGGLPV